jgi:RimJ/RimL family protein N-acetyltransferase
MILLSPDQIASVKSWFLPDRPGLLLGLHAIYTGLGKFFADRWPEPRAILVETAGNYSLSGDPEAFAPVDLIGGITGVVDAPKSFLPLLQRSFPELKIWERVILTHETDLPTLLPCAFPLRRLTKVDTNLISQLSPEVAWITKTWNGPDGLARSGYAWAALDGRKILSLSCSFCVGQTYEDIGVVTEPAFRGQGLSVSCTAALCRDIIARGRRLSWSTSIDNLASLRVAEKLGFQFQRYDCLYAINQPIPDPPDRDQVPVD